MASAVAGVTEQVRIIAVRLFRCVPLLDHGFPIWSIHPQVIISCISDLVPSVSGSERPDGASR